MSIYISDGFAEMPTEIDKRWVEEKPSDIYIHGGKHEFNRIQ